jgi:kynurenine formamidase
MCSPEVMARVRSAVSRRGFVGGVAGLGAAALAGGLARPSGARAARQGATPVAGTVNLPSFAQVVDLTHVVSPDFPMFPGTPALEQTTAVTIAANGYYANMLTLNEHTGTHMDAPAHFIEGGDTAELIPVERLFAPLAVVDISARAASDPDTQVMPDDILVWETANGPLPVGAFVAMYSGWESRLSDPVSYVNLDASGVQHYPGFHPDTAALLTTEREIVGIGVDTLSQDFGASTDFLTHVTILGAGKYGVENVANLGQVPPAGGYVVIGGPKHRAASGGPTRALALF